MAGMRHSRPVSEMRVLGQKVAARLRSGHDVYQGEAAVKSGIAERTYYRWLDGEEEGHLAFQAEVLPALYDQAKMAEAEAERAIGCVEGGSGPWQSWHRWKLEKRFRRIYGAVAEQKIELTGKDGGPVETRELRDLPTDELLSLLKATEDE